MKKLFLLFIAIPLFSLGQKTPKETIETYFDGYQKGDSTILKEVFHPNFHLSWISPWHSGREQFKQVDRKGMFAFFGPNWNQLTIQSSIDELTIHDNVATCVATVELEGIVTWTDYISMLKIDGKWWIVSKVSEGVKHGS